MQPRSRRQCSSLAKSEHILFKSRLSHMWLYYLTIRFQLKARDLMWI